MYEALKQLKKNNNMKEGTGNVDKRALEYWEKSTRKFIWVTYVKKFNIVRLKEYVFNNTGRIGGGGEEYQWMETSRIIIWLCWYSKSQITSG